MIRIQCVGLKNLISRINTESYVEGGPLNNYALMIDVDPTYDYLYLDRDKSWKLASGHRCMLPMVLYEGKSMEFEGEPWDTTELYLCKIPEGYLIGALISRPKLGS